MTTPVPASQKGRMLPGVAGIIMFLLFFTLINVFAAARGVYGTGRGRTFFLLLCTILVVGLFGLLKMTRWGFSIVLAGCLTLSAGFFYLFSHTHIVPHLIMGGFMLIFFLYLVRPEVRDRMR